MFKFVTVPPTPPPGPGYPGPPAMAGLHSLGMRLWEMRLSIDICVTDARESYRLRFWSQNGRTSVSEPRCFFFRLALRLVRRPSYICMLQLYLYTRLEARSPSQPSMLCSPHPVGRCTLATNCSEQAAHGRQLAVPSVPYPHRAMRLDGTRRRARREPLGIPQRNQPLSLCVAHPVPFPRETDTDTDTETAIYHILSYTLQGRRQPLP